jgi:predicted PurR-regulated permease PerM
MVEARETRWQVPNALRVAVLFLAAVIVLLFLWTARSLVLTAFLATIAGLAIARAADWLQEHRIKRAVGAPLTMLLVIGALAGLIALIAPTVREQTSDLGKELPKVVHLVEGKLGMSEGLEAVVQREMKSIGKMLFPVVSSTFEAAAGLLILIFIAIYIGISPHTYRKGIVHLIPHAKREEAESVLTELVETLRGWLTARLIAMVAIGVITAGGLALLQVKAALALGLIAGLLELIPFYGPVISAIPAIGVALTDSPQKALYVVLLYLVIQQIEGNLLTPMILKRRLEIPPVLTILAVSAFGVVFGVLGMLAAEPLTAATLLLVKRLYVRDVIGDELD